MPVSFNLELRAGRPSTSVLRLSPGYKQKYQHNDKG
jgi:hypothetical protein